MFTFLLMSKSNRPIGFELLLEFAIDVILLLLTIKLLFENSPEDFCNCDPGALL